jgi:hypothetical protein
MAVVAVVSRDIERKEKRERRKKDLRGLNFPAVAPSHLV